jgi:hypothetical protein
VHYDPTGDNVPVQKRQKFQFDRAELRGTYVQDTCAAAIVILLFRLYVVN